MWAENTHSPVCMFMPSSSIGKDIGPDSTQGAAAPKRIRRDPPETTKPLRVQRFGGKHGFSYNCFYMHGCSFK